MKISTNRRVSFRFFLPLVFLLMIWPFQWGWGQVLKEAEFLTKFDEHLLMSLQDDASLQNWEQAEEWISDIQISDAWENFDAALGRSYPLPPSTGSAGDWLRCAMVQALRDDVDGAKSCYQEAIKRDPAVSAPSALAAFAVTDDPAWAAEMVPKIPSEKLLEAPLTLRRFVRGIKDPALVERMLKGALETTLKSPNPLLRSQRCLGLLESLGNWEAAVGRTNGLVALLESYISCVLKDSSELSPIGQCAFTLMVDVATELNPKLAPDHFLSLAWKIAHALPSGQSQPMSELTESMHEIGLPNLVRDGVGIEGYLIRATLNGKPVAEKQEWLAKYLASTLEEGVAHPLAWILKHRNSKPADFAKACVRYFGAPEGIQSGDPVEPVDPFSQTPAGTIAVPGFAQGLQQLVFLAQWSDKTSENAARLDALFEATELLAKRMLHDMEVWGKLRWKTFSKLPSDRPTVIAWIEGYAKRCSAREIQIERGGFSSADLFAPFDPNQPVYPDDEFTLFWSAVVKDTESLLHWLPVWKKLSDRYGLPCTPGYTTSILRESELFTAEQWQELLLPSPLWAGSAEFESDAVSENGRGCFLHCVNAAMAAGLRPPSKIPKGGFPFGRALFYACMEPEPIAAVLREMNLRKDELALAPFQCHAALAGILGKLRQDTLDLGPIPPLDPPLESLAEAYEALFTNKVPEFLPDFEALKLGIQGKMISPQDDRKSPLPFAWRVCPKQFWEYLELYHAQLLEMKRNGADDECYTNHSTQFLLHLMAVLRKPFWTKPWHPSGAEFVRLMKFIVDGVADGTLSSSHADYIVQWVNWKANMDHENGRVDWVAFATAAGDRFSPTDLPLLVRPILEMVEGECRTEYGTVGFPLSDQRWLESAAKGKAGHAWFAQWLLDCVAMRQAFVAGSPRVERFGPNDLGYTAPPFPTKMAPTPSSLRAAQRRMFNLKLNDNLSAIDRLFYHGDLVEWAGVYAGEDFVFRAGALLKVFPPALHEKVKYDWWGEFSSLADHIACSLLSLAEAEQAGSSAMALKQLGEILTPWRSLEDGLISNDALLDIALAVRDEAAVADLWPKERPTVALLIRLLRADRLAEAHQLWRKNERAIFVPSTGSYGLCVDWWRLNDDLPQLETFLSSLPPEERLGAETLILLDRGHALDAPWQKAGLHLNKLKVLVEKCNAASLKDADRQLLLTERLLSHPEVRSMVSVGQIQQVLATLPEVVGPPRLSEKLDCLFTLWPDNLTLRRLSLESGLARAQALAGDWTLYQRDLQRAANGLSLARTAAKHQLPQKPLNKWDTPKKQMTYAAFNDDEFTSPATCWLEFSETLLRQWQGCDAASRQQLRRFLREQIFDERWSMCFDPLTFYKLRPEDDEFEDSEQYPNWIPLPESDAARLMMAIFLHAVDDAGKEFTDAFQALSAERQQYLRHVANTMSWQRALKFIRMNYPWENVTDRLVATGGVMDRFFSMLPAAVPAHSPNAKPPVQWEIIAKEWGLTPSEFMEWFKR